MTRLFDLADSMETACAAVPELTGRVGVERTMPIAMDELPVVNIIPRTVRRGDLQGDLQSRDASILVIVRTAGDRPGRAADALLAKAHAAMTTHPDLNDGSAQIDLASETFRYVDTEQSMCDLQAEYLITYEHARESLLGY